MNGSTLALGLTAALAAAGALSRRGGRGPDEDDARISYNRVSR